MQGCLYLWMRPLSGTKPCHSSDGGRFGLLPLPFELDPGWQVNYLWAPDFTATWPFLSTARCVWETQRSSLNKKTQSSEGSLPLEKYQSLLTEHNGDGHKRQASCLNTYKQLNGGERGLFFFSPEKKEKGEELVCGQVIGRQRVPSSFQVWN